LEGSHRIVPDKLRSAMSGTFAGRHFHDKDPRVGAMRVEALN
jgi:hypothetical protein